MRPPGTSPTGVERTFGENELIVSKTDDKGVIRYANSVFLKVARLAEEQAVGSPHNIIRHPDMPRCVFHLLWERIASGREIFAYVLNLAADGAHYWVYAHVTPSFTAGRQIVGYHSNRRLPDRPAVRAAAALYDHLRAAERRHDRTVDAVAAGTAALTGALRDRGQRADPVVRVRRVMGWAPTDIHPGRSAAPVRPSMPPACGFAIVSAMSDEYIDPSGNTAQFRAFVSEPEPAPDPTRRIAILVAIGVLAAVAVGLAVWALS